MLKSGKIKKGNYSGGPVENRHFQPASEKKEGGCLTACEEGTMEGFLFLVFWLGCASLHTLYDLKVKPVLQSLKQESDFF